MISILFCGKDKELLDASLKAFRKQPYRFVHVSDWQSVFEEIEREKFDVAIVDLGVHYFVDTVQRDAFLVVAHGTSIQAYAR